MAQRRVDVLPGSALRRGAPAPAVPLRGEREEFELSDDEVDEGDFLRVDPLESSVEYGWMAEFADSVRDQRLRELLDVALGGRGAFRWFKHVLVNHPRERDRWFRFRDERVREAMRAWLEDNDIEPTTEPPERPPG